MEEQKNKLLKKGILETEADFTSNVMNSINSEETRMSNLLSKYGMVEPSADFTTQLMRQLEGKSPAVPYTPVISKKAWIGIAAVFVGVIILTLFSGTNNPKGTLFDDELNQLTTMLDALFSDGSAFPYLMLGGLILSIGLVIEQKMKTKVANK